MDRTERLLRLVRYGGIAAALMGVLPGCLSPCGRFRGGRERELPADVTPQPLGTFAHDWQEAQATKAEASDFAIFNDEWYQGGARLGPHGQVHLRNIARRLPSVPFPVVIQPHVDEALNDVRRQHVVEVLITAGIADADRRVVVDIPQAEGLPGEEAERIMLEGYTPNHFGPLRGGGGGGFGRFGGGFGRFGGFNR